MCGTGTRRPSLLLLRPVTIVRVLLVAIAGCALALLFSLVEHRSAHALDLLGLRAREITFWSAWEGEAVVGVGALRHLGDGHGEIKSMHTAEAARGRGVGSAMLRHIMAAARARGMSRLSLETGSWPYFEPARALYARHGFVECGPFGDYREDPNSVFMTRELNGA